MHQWDGLPVCTPSLWGNWGQLITHEPYLQWQFHSVFSRFCSFKYCRHSTHSSAFWPPWSRTTSAYTHHIPPSSSHVWPKDFSRLASPDAPLKVKDCNLGLVDGCWNQSELSFVCKTNSGFPKRVDELVAKTWKPHGRKQPSWMMMVTTCCMMCVAFGSGFYHVWRKHLEMK